MYRIVKTSNTYAVITKQKTPARRLVAVDKISTPSEPQTKLRWCRWTRSPGTTASCFDIGALLNGSTPPKPPSTNVHS